VYGGIIQTAVTDKTLCLELEYRQPYTPRDGEARQEPASDIGFTFQYDDPQVSDEFACLLMVI
jgi:hypothetical protein